MKLYILAQGFSEGKGSYYAFVEELARHAHKKGHKVIILAHHMQGQKTEEDRGYARVIRFKLKNPPVFGSLINVYLFSRKVRAYFKQNPPKEGDRIVANGYTPLGLEFPYVVRAPDQPVRTYLQNMSHAPSPFVSRVARTIHFKGLYHYDKEVMNNAAGIIYSSNQNKRENERYYEVSNTPYFIPNKAVDIRRIQRAKHKDMKNTLLFVARNDEKIRKGAIYLEKALPKIFKEHDANLLHLGATFSWDIPKTYRDRIIAPGKVPREKMYEYYRSVDAMVICSLNEGIPAVVVEAMAAGLPIVSSDIEGIDEYVFHKKTGYIYRRADVKGLQSGIQYALTHTEELKRNAGALVKKMKSLDIETYYARLLEFIENKNAINLIGQLH